MTLKEQLTSERHKMYLEQFAPMAEQIRTKVEEAVRADRHHLNVKVRLVFDSSDIATLYLNDTKHHTFDIGDLIGTLQEKLEVLLAHLSPAGFEDQTYTYHDMLGEQSIYQIGFDINPVY